MGEEDFSYILYVIQKIEAFTQCKAVVETYKGGAYSIMDGMITGEFLECTRPSKIVQKWRLKSWPDGKMCYNSILSSSQVGLCLI